MNEGLSIERRAEILKALRESSLKKETVEPDLGNNTQIEKEQVDFFDTEGLARFLNVSKKSIIKWREAGRLPGMVRCGRIFRFRRNAIEKKLLSGTLLLNK